MSQPLGVLLIHPGEPQRIFQGLEDEFTSIEPPSFAGLFATYLNIKGVSTEIVDAPARGLSPEDVAVITDFLNPRLVVIVVYGAQPSASTQNMTSAYKIADAIKEWGTYPIMMTGTHPAALPAITMLEGLSIDFVCDREGPVTIFKAHQALKAGLKPGFDDFSQIPSLWSRDQSGRPRPPSEAEGLIVDLDAEMPHVAWRYLPVDRYRSHNWHAFDHIHSRAPYAAIHTSLGCPYKCHFCCINAPFGKPAYRMWNANTTMREIDTLAREYGVVNLKFIDEMFVLNRAHVLELCRQLSQREYKVNIWAYARVDTVQDEFLDALKSAGVNWLCLGIESASSFVRDGALKRYGNEDIINTVRRIQAAGIYVIGNYIFGLPDDTPLRMQETLDLALELNCEYANFYSAMAYPGSKLYTQAVGSGRKLPAKWEDYSQHGYGTLPLANDHLSSADILAFRDHAFTAYFTSQGYLAMLDRKFGPSVVDHVKRMTRIPIKRKLLES